RPRPSALSSLPYPTLFGFLWLFVRGGGHLRYIFSTIDLFETIRSSAVRCCVLATGIQIPLQLTIPFAAETCCSGFKVLKEVEGRSEEHTSELQSRGQLVCR